MKRELSYQFDLDIERVHLVINMKCDVQVWWKSGKRKISTKNPLKLTGTQKYFDVRQKLSIIAKIGVQNGVMQEKKTELLIILFTSQNTSKLGGRVYLNLAQFISPEGLTVPVARKCERSLENCPDQASKIVFNLSCKYIEENFGGPGTENLHDISFQANTFSHSFGTVSTFGRTNDMTFRPEKQRDQDNSSRWGNYSQSNQNPRQEYSSKQRKRSDNDRDRDKQKMDTPSWDRGSYRDKQQPQTANQSGRNRQKQSEKQTSSQPQQRPLEFSFNPLTPSDRQKMGLDNSEMVRDLKQIVEERGRTIKSLQEQLAKVRGQYNDRSEKSSAKSIGLLNELNAATAQREQVQREKSQMTSQMEHLKEENKKLEQKCKMMHFQYSEANNEFMSKLEQRKQMIEQLNSKLEESDRRVNKYRDDLFRKENELITKERQFIDVQISKEAINKEQTEKLKAISAALKELQTDYEKSFKEKEDLKNKWEETNYKLEKSSDQIQKLSQTVTKLEEELQREREKTSLIESKYKQREAIIQQIESEFNLFSVQKGQLLKQKDEQISSLREKFNAACKKIDDVAGGEQSMKNLISQKNVKIKTLQTMYQQLQKTFQQKQELIGKAKEYIRSKQLEIQTKNDEIAKRDEFIQKCRTYMETKQKEYNQAIAGFKNTNNNPEVQGLRKQIRDKDVMLEEYISERHRSDRQIDDMAKVIDRLKMRVMECQDYMDELQRKNESQEGTLKDLVKKNLDMEIQLNIKDYEIQSLKSTK